ncbi:hypothetical protein NMG60_11031931 [Bertholletia excelsa]
MGCFLACFGFSKKRRRRKPAYKGPSGDQSHGSYKPLDSDVSIISDNPNSSESQSSGKGKERSSLKIKKKVSFNLNVKTYEPLPSSDFSRYFLDSEEENTKESEKVPRYSDSVEPKTITYPSGHRYQNCSDIYDEDDDIKLEESDLDQDEEEDGDNEDEEVELDGGDEEIGQEVKWIDGEWADKTRSLADSLDQELNKLGLSESKAPPRDRSQYVFSVLNPVENLAQWKQVKTKLPPSRKQQRKENIGFPLIDNPSSKHSESFLKDIAVDASLSNWLQVSPKTLSITSSLQRR